MVRRRRFARWLLASCSLITAAPAAGSASGVPTGGAPAPQPPSFCASEDAPPFAGHIGEFAADSTPSWPSRPRPAPGAPNVLIWLVDDLGFGQLASFGGFIETPNLDRVIARGFKYSNFHATPVCSASRAALLTGRNSHSVHMGAHALQTMGFPGYDGRVPRSAATTAKLLQKAGYGTIALGKWDHVPVGDISPAGPFDQWPLGQGFDRFYGYLAAETDQFAPTLWQDNSIIAEPRSGQEYTLTHDLADRAVDYVTGLKSADPAKPFYMYWAPGAIHYPHQVPETWRQKYRGKFDMGWDKAQELILARQRSLGVTPASARPAERPPGIPAWSSLSLEERKLFARQMEIVAAYMSQADFEFGRILDALERTGQLDNTLIIVTSDNGASGEGGRFGATREMAAPQGLPATLQENFAHYDSWGGPQSPGHYAAGWAVAGNTPFRDFKQSALEGGVHVPAVISWPARIKAHGEVRSDYHHLIDIGPTVLEAAGVKSPACVDGVRQQALDGYSMLKELEGGPANPRRVQYYEYTGNRSIYADGWKAVVQHKPEPYDYRKPQPFGKDRWTLFDVRRDPGESNDLAAREPEKLKALQALFDEQARKYNVYPLDDDSSRAFARNKRSGDRFEFFGPGAYGFSEQMGPTLLGGDYQVDAMVRSSASANGVIFANGGQEAGYSLYVKDGRVQYYFNQMGRTIFRLSAALPLADGRNRISYRFHRLSPTRARGELLINGAPAAAGEFDFHPMAMFSGGPDGFGVGRDLGHPATDDYPAPFAFDGQIDAVVFTLAPKS